MPNDTLPALAKQDVQLTKVGAILPANIQEAVTMSKMLFSSGLFKDVQNAEQAFVKILAGAEMGLPPFASLNGFHIVQGKVMLHYSVIAAGIRRAGYSYRVLEHDETRCTVEISGRQGEILGQHTFTKEDASKAQTQNMAKLPKVMLFARCISQAARIFVPEAFNGAVVYSHEERDLIEESAEQTPASVPQPKTSESVRTKVAVGDPAGDEFDPFEYAEPQDSDDDGSFALESQ